MFHLWPYFTVGVVGNKSLKGGYAEKAALPKPQAFNLSVDSTMLLAIRSAIIDDPRRLFPANIPTLLIKFQMNKSEGSDNQSKGTIRQPLDSKCRMIFVLLKTRRGMF